MKEIDGVLFLGQQVELLVRLIEAADLRAELPPAGMLEDVCLPESIIAMAMFDYLLKHKPTGNDGGWDSFLREALEESISKDTGQANTTTRTN